jgi:hypothetical protein
LNYYGGKKKISLKFHTQCPFVLLVKVGCKQGKALGSAEGGRADGKRNVALRGGGNKLSFWAEFGVWSVA